MPDDVGIVEQLARQLGRVQHLDHPRPVIHERAMQRLAAADRDEVPPLGLGKRRRQKIAHLHARERPDAIPALLRAERLDVRELHIGPVLDVLLKQVLVGRGVDVVEDRAAVGVAGAQGPRR